MRKVYLHITLVFFLYGTSFAQTNSELKISTDTSHYIFGDIINARLELASSTPNLQIKSLGYLLDSLNTNSEDDFGSLEILLENPWSYSSGLYSTDLQIGAYDTGHQFYIYPIEIISAGASDTLLSTPAYFYVQPVEVDSTGLAPIKDIIEEPINIQDALPFIIAGIALVLLILIIVYLVKRKSRKKTIISEPVIQIPAHELALQKLDDLEAKKLWQQGEIKTYQSELTFILREYIEKTLNVRALEQTTSETIRSLRETQIEEEKLRDLANMFNIADLVKFAKGQPEINIHVELMQKAKEFIYYVHRRNQILEMEEE